MLRIAVLIGTMSVALAGSLLGDVVMEYPENAAHVTDGKVYPRNVLDMEREQGWWFGGAMNGNGGGVRVVDAPGRPGEKGLEFHFVANREAPMWFCWEYSLDPQLSIEGVREFVFDVYPLEDIRFPIYARFGRQQGQGQLPCCWSSLGDLEANRWQTVRVRVEHTRPHTDTIRFDMDNQAANVPYGRKVAFVVDNLRFVPPPAEWTNVPSQSLAVSGPVRAGYLQCSARGELSTEDAIELLAELEVTEETAGTLVVTVQSHDGRSWELAEALPLEPPYSTIKWQGDLFDDQPSGQYSLSVRITDSSGQVLASSQAIDLRVFSRVEMENRRQTLLKELERLDAVAAEGRGDVEMARVYLTTARMFLDQYVLEDFDQQRKYSIATDELAKVDRLLLEAERELSRPEGPATPGYDPNQPVEVRNDVFVHQDKPFVMIGPLAWGDADDAIAVAGDLGFNAIVSEAPLGKPVQRYVELAREHGLATLVLMGSHYFNVPEEYAGKFDDLTLPETGHVGLPYNILSEGVRTIMRDWYGRAFEPVRSHGNLVAVCTANEPGYGVGPQAKPFETAFRRWAQSRYATIDAANAAWESSFASFEAIELPALFELRSRSQAAAWDWGVFLAEKVGDYFAFLKDEIHKSLPRAQVHIKLIGEMGFSHLDEQTVFDRGETVHGTDGGHRMWLDYLKSIDPAKPVVNSEWHSILNPETDENPARVAQAMFEAVAHGLGAGLIWQWHRFEWDSPVNGASESMTRYPTGLAAAGTTSLKLRRLYPLISRFGQLDGGRTRLVYSKASHAHQGAEYLRGLTSVYEKLAANAAGVRFVLPDRTTADDLKGVDFIAAGSPEYLPTEFAKTLASWTEAGGTLWLTGPGLSRDPWGKSHTDVPAEFLQLAASEGSHQYGRGRIVVDGESDVWRSYLSGPVPTCADGSINGQIEVRLASSDDGEAVMYLMNRSDRPQVFRLIDLPEGFSATARDLWEGAAAFDLSQPIELRPHQVVLLDMRRTNP